jgi:transposase
MRDLKLAADKRRNVEEEALRQFERVVIEHLLAGTKPGVIAEETGYSYETIRRIARKYDVKPLREPTVTSRKKQ